LSQIIRYQINGLILAVRHNRGGSNSSPYPNSNATFVGNLSAKATRFNRR
jgi:hypothetical protein